MKKLLMTLAAILLFASTTYAEDNADLTVTATVANVPLALTWDNGGGSTLATGPYYTDQTYTTGGTEGWTVAGNVGAAFTVTLSPASSATSGNATLAYTSSGLTGQSFIDDGTGKGTGTGTLTFGSFYSGTATGGLSFAIKATVSYP